MDRIDGAAWRKSTYSGGSGSECVEVGRVPGKVAIRDTKDHGAGPVLTVPAAAWRSFTATLR